MRRTDVGPDAGRGAGRGLRISVVVPVRDDAALLERCLRSLQAQTRPPWEVVVVDNASSDDSAAVARRHGARVVTEPVRGVPAAAARGYDSVTGEVIARCDADSVVPTDWLARIHDRFERDPRLDAITGPGRFYDLPPPWAGPAAVLYAVGAFGATGSALAGIPLWGSNMALRRATWESVRHLVSRTDPDLHDDLDLSMALGPGARVRLDPRLQVGVAGRIFASRAQARRRVDMAMRTLRRGWAQGGSPGRRWLARGGATRWADLPVRPAAPSREEVVLLDARGGALGTAPKAAVHHEDTPLHLAFSCYVVDDAGRVLMSRRAWDKATFPGLVTNSVCGHPAPGEPLAEAVRRRARTELGLTLDEVRVVLPDFAYRAEMDGVVEHELCPVHVAPVSGSVAPQPDPTEVAETWWEPWPALRDGVLAGDREVSPWCAEQVVLLADLPDDPRRWPAADLAALPPAAAFPAAQPPAASVGAAF
ncbi:isopentenyl-diphosphate Delta-isomerase [Arsenicicoccus dermatophilus]|uniref:isopentenyl-diphosphate Delta-isomerase n=1 Tax=Arsenicicoccus dermatophilus TaxID=1076331 RepID=UPI003892ABCF